MIPTWLEPSGVVDTPWMALALVATGAGIGLVGGLFGVSGCFLLTPVLAEVLGIPYLYAIGSASCHAVGVAATSLRRHLRFGSVNYQLGLALATGAGLGALLGGQICSELSQQWSDTRYFDMIVRITMLVMYGLVALFIARGNANGRDAVLQRIRYGFRWAVPGVPGKSFSVPAGIAVSFVCGTIVGFLGLGGGVLYLPLLVLAIGATSHDAVRVSLLIVLCSAVAGTISHAWAGHVSLAISMLLICGSSLGVQVGAAICHRIRDRGVQKYFALVVLLAIALIAWNMIRGV